MINSLNSILFTGISSAKSIITNIKNNTIGTKQVQDSVPVVDFKPLFVQIQAMAEFDNASPFGKRLNVII